MSTISLRENVNKLGGWGDFPEIEIPHRVTSYGLRVTNWRSAFSATDHWEYVRNLWIASPCNLNTLREIFTGNHRKARSVALGALLITHLSWITRPVMLGLYQSP